MRVHGVVRGAERQNHHQSLYKEHTHGYAGVDSMSIIHFFKATFVFIFAKEYLWVRVFELQSLTVSALDRCQFPQSQQPPPARQHLQQSRHTRVRLV